MIFIRNMIFSSVADFQDTMDVVKFGVGSVSIVTEPILLLEIEGLGMKTKAKKEIVIWFFKMRHVKVL